MELDKKLDDFTKESYLKKQEEKKEEKKQSLKVVTEDDNKDKYLNFTIDNSDYAIFIGFVSEIVGMLPITEVPNQEEFIRGVVNLRGQIKPVMDVRKKFNKSDVEYDDRACIIIVDIEDFSVGLIVDTVKEVLLISESEIAVPPEFKKDIVDTYVSGIGQIKDETKIILDCKKLIMG
ncbi:chemotaxis protein CheW [Peptostreptococcaceae bacterium AGR-M142]